MIRHMVHLRFRDVVSTQEKNALFDRLADLSERLADGCVFEVARNVSVETHLVRGFQDLFWIDFDTVAARDAYLADPEHIAISADIVACLEGGAEGVFVCDTVLRK